MMHKSGVFKGRERWVGGNRERENIAGVLILVLFQTQCAYLIPSQVCNGACSLTHTGWWLLHSDEKPVLTWREESCGEYKSFLHRFDLGHTPKERQMSRDVFFLHIPSMCGKIHFISCQMKNTEPEKEVYKPQVQIQCSKTWGSLVYFC